MNIVAKFNRFFIYTYSFRYLGYFGNVILQKLKLKPQLKNKWIEISDYDKDLNIKINPAEHIGHRIFFKGYYEALEVWAFKRLVAKDAYIFDIGANIGVWTLLFSKMVSNGKVFAFEPSKWYDILQYNIVSNSCTHNVSLFKLGFGNENALATVQEQEFAFTKHKTFNIGSNRLLLHFNTTLRDQVEVQTLDNWISSNPIPRLDWIKLDTEGMEHMIIQGGFQSLLKYKPSLMIEFNPITLAHYATSVADLVNTLKKLGYIYFYAAGRRGKLHLLDMNSPWGTLTKNAFCSMQPLLL